MTTSQDADRQIWRAPLFGFLLTLTLLKGIRMPNRWAVTHYLLTYRQGFIKRGFWGEMLSLVFGSWTSNYFTLAIIGLLVLGVTVGCVIYVCRALPDTPARLPVLIVVAASPAVAFAAHMVGYLEQLGYLACAALMLQRSWRWRVATAMAAAALLPLVHEASMLWVGALTCLVLLVGGPAYRSSAAANRRKRLAAVGVVAAIWFVSTVSVVQFGRVSSDRAAAIRDERTSFFELRPRQDAFHALTVSTSASLKDMRVRWADPEAWADMAASLAVFAPGAIFLMMLSIRQARVVAADAMERRAIVLLIAAAVIGPLLLHFVGWDRHRWNALAALNAGLAAIILLAATPRSETVSIKGAHSAVLRRGTMTVAMALCLWGAASDLVLFDSYSANFAPYRQKIEFMIKAITHPDRAMWLPRQGE